MQPIWGEDNLYLDSQNIHSVTGRFHKDSTKEFEVSTSCYHFFDRRDGAITNQFQTVNSKWTDTN